MQIINLDGEILTEVITEDTIPFDDDDNDSTAWTDADIEAGYEDEVGDLDDQNVVDQSLAYFQGHGQNVYCVGINPKSNLRIISGGGDDRGFLWNYLVNVDGVIGENGKNINGSMILSDHHDTVTSVGFSSDGTLAFTGGYDGLLQIWDAYTGQLKAKFDGPEDIEWAQWHPKGHAIIAGSNDGTVWLWVEADKEWRCAQVGASSFIRFR